ncbi:glycosyltransferase family protein [Fuscibacter oryzae]|uniref:Glycosyltransferase like family protein n=1 Tax=Fuscibacter oryzae TaxID=2803939 RepID=A0A8J7SVV4_9RHOB|nr:hypothetical protein [Fuscibacter oryzae]MBL4928209.1 hypothetical protein [Fuscibacter oryzae]
MKIVLCCASHSEAILNANLGRSPCIIDGSLPLHVEWGAPSASVAYNRALDATDAEIVVFVHHDVYLPKGWDAVLRARLAELPDDWALFGSFGVALDAGHIGPVWSSSIGLIAGSVALKPVEVQSFDELLIIMKRSAGLRFDEELPGWHMYGTDIVAIARAKGFRAYAGALPLIHNDRYHEALDSDFTACYHYMRRKWRAVLPLRSPIIKISKSGLHIWRNRWRDMRSRDFRENMAIDTEVQPEEFARRCGWVDLGPSA